MVIKDVVEWYGSQANMARAMGVTPVSVSLWMRDGYMPPARAIELEVKSGGKFKAVDLIKTTIG